MAGNRMSRRRALAMAGAGVVGVSVAGVAGLSLAGETPETEAAASTSAPLVISLRDAKKGTFDVFSGASKKTVTDKKFAAQLLKAVHG
ncbi:hypothetical protein [Actinoplanes sp. NPDC051411]|uniref:hypothetical protein n=1 Tax=Actinoplanes sp. NPDC051411 TaxID=3155522 RepID=UPI00341F01E7